MQARAGSCVANATPHQPGTHPHTPTDVHTSQHTHICCVLTHVRATQRPTSDTDCTFRKCRLAAFNNSELVFPLRRPFVEITDGTANIAVFSRDIAKDCKCEANLTQCYSKHATNDPDLYLVSIAAKVVFTGGLRSRVSSVQAAVPANCGVHLHGAAHNRT